jgi:uncharacterized membrane protein YccC
MRGLILGLLAAAAVMYLIGLGPLALLAVPPLLVGLYVYKRRGVTAGAASAIMVFAILMVAALAMFMATDRSDGFIAEPETQQGP